jgi:hypothetical protein
MPRWMLACPKCFHKFTHTTIEVAIIEESRRDPFNILPRPRMLHTGEPRACPKLQRPNLFTSGLICSTANSSSTAWATRFGCGSFHQASVVKQCSPEVVIQQRQRECLQIEPANSFGILGIQTVPLDTMLAELIELAVTQTRQRRAPVAVGRSAANVGFGACGLGHKRISKTLV